MKKKIQKNIHLRNKINVCADSLIQINFYFSKFLDTGILFMKFKVCDILSKVVHVHSLQKLTEQ